MNAFPRTEVGGLSVSRMIIGTNWLIGASHCTRAKDRFIREVANDRKAIAAVFKVFFAAGVDTIMGGIDFDSVYEAIKDAEDETGRKAVWITTPIIPVSPQTPVTGFDVGEVERIVDFSAQRGVAICMPHSATTDCMVDRCTREVRKIDTVCKAIRDRGMIPGLSTHLPETIIYADETALDVDTYIAIYNSLGFLMPLEVDWTAQIIQNAKKPVMTIKPMAAGQLRPLQGMSFVWNTIRPQDMVTVGTMTQYEAEELIELSLSILQNRPIDLELQDTRSKAPVKPAEKVAPHS